MDFWKLWFIEHQEMFSSTRPYDTDDMKPVRQRSIILSDQRKRMCPRVKNFINNKVLGYNYMKTNSKGGTSVQNSPTGIDQALE